MGSAGDPPVPVGDSPTGRPRRSLTKHLSLLARGAPSVPPGESPGGTGQWPVLPKTNFRTRSEKDAPHWVLSLAMFPLANFAAPASPPLPLRRSSQMPSFPPSSALRRRTVVRAGQEYAVAKNRDGDLDSVLPVAAGAGFCHDRLQSQIRGL